MASKAGQWAAVIVLYALAGYNALGDALSTLSAPVMVENGDNNNNRRLLGLGLVTFPGTPTVFPGNTSTQEGRISVLSRWGSFGALSDVPEKSLGNNSLIGSKRRDFTYVVMKYDGYQTTSIGLTTQQPERATCFPNVPVNWDTIEDTCGNSDDKGIADVNGDRFNSRSSRGTSISSYGTTIYDTELVQGAPEPFRLWAAEEDDFADETDDFLSKMGVPATIALQKMHAPFEFGLTNTMGSLMAVDHRALYVDTSLADPVYVSDPVSVSDTRSLLAVDHRALNQDHAY